MTVWHMCFVQVNIQTDLSAEELEQREVPRTGRGRNAALSKTIASNALNSGKPPVKAGRSKSHMLKRRLKAKTAYLEKLAAAGKYDPARPTPPDPER